jgi:hypothetical protein
MSTNVMGFQQSRKITNIFGILILLTKVDSVQGLMGVNS